MFLQKRRMRKCANCDCILRQLIADVRRAKTVTYASEPRRFRSVLLLDRVDPFGHSNIRESCVLAFPSLVVKVRVRGVIPVFSMFPDWVLRQ